jgi:hypothetical protein
MLACDVCAKKNKLNPAYEYVVELNSKDQVIKFTPLSIALCKECSKDTYDILVNVMVQRTKEVQ